MSSLFFINILILERGSGMKSYSQFITEKKKSEGPESVNQADVSKKAAKYRRAERTKGATGGKTTGSLSRGTLSFPGDRSGATTRVKSDIEARKGFSDSKSGGLKADETNKFVDRSVRQTRATAAGTPDPFDPKTPKAPSRPFKSLTKTRRTGSTSIPDPFRSSTTVPPIVKQTAANKYIRSMQDKGIKVNQDFVDAQGLKASGAKPEMVGSRAPSGAGAKFRAKADAVKDISNVKNTNLDKALKNLTTTGNVKGKSTGVSGGLTAPKGGVTTSPGVGPKSYSKSEKTLQNMQRQMAQSGVDSSGRKLTTAERRRAFNVAKNPRAVEITKPKSSATSVGSRLSKGSSSSALALPGQKGLPPKKIKLPKAKPELATKVKQALPSLGSGSKSVRPGVSATIKPASNLSKLKGFARGAGRVAGPALAVVGAGLDYADDRAKGYNRTSSALRTGAKHLGGAAGGALGSVLGPLGTAAGYAAGHWLTSKVLDKFHKPSKPKKLEQPTAKQKVTSAIENPIRGAVGAPPKKLPAPKKVEKNPMDYLKVNR